MTTPYKFNELNQAEEPARILLERLGWTYVPREALAAERGGEREVLLKGRLKAALLRLNDWMTDEQAQRVTFDLEHMDAVGMARNQAVHERLTYGMNVAVDVARGPDTRSARFFDFDHPESGLNEFVVTTQFRLRRGGPRQAQSERGPHDDDQRMVIPDLVLFVNGIPLVVMEAKSPTLADEWKSLAVRQLRRYQEAGPEWAGAGAPELFHYDLICVGHCGLKAVFSSIGAPESAYFEWKSVLPYSDDEVRQRFGTEPTGQAQLIVGLLNPTTLLDILRDYVVYEPEHGRVVKKLPRYQQYRAVNKAVRRILDGRRSSERGGVVWHTQGSGKSLTMLWLATKLRRERRLTEATIVTVTDRTQLDDQIAGTFRRCGFETPDRVVRSKPMPPQQLARWRTSHPNESDPLDLQTALIRGGARTMMTTIQKFEEVLDTPQGELNLLNASENIIVMVDEAHRTQYGLLGAKMAQALPNAVLVGFTGTPIDKGFGRSTMRHFGPLIDAYTIPQSVADGATVPIYYEARLPELSIQGPNTLDKLFDAMFRDQPEEDRARISRRYANKETVAEAERRIQLIALDIADHFNQSVRPNGFKAQVVAPSRAAAVRYAEHLNSFSVSAYPVITTSANDGPEFQVARGLNHDQVISSFTDPKGEAQILVVVDMLLTGFDAPPEQVLYLDRSLHEHVLLQAVARVNRTFSHEHAGVSTAKEYGLVVDYHGVSQDLHEAFSTFDWPDVQDTLHALEEDPSVLLESAAVQAESHFKGHDLADLWDCVSLFAPDANTEGNYKADVFERFNVDYRQFSRLMDRTLPKSAALPYADRLARLTAIRAWVRAQYLREDAHIDWTDIGAKVKKLIDERIDAEVRKLMKPVSVLDDDFDEKIASLPHDEARASMMEHAIRAYINERLADNPTFFEKLSEQLERIIQDLRNRVIDAAEAARRAAAIKGQIETEEDIAAALGLSAVSFAIYELLRDGPPSSVNGKTAQRRVQDEKSGYHTDVDEDARDISRQVEGVIDLHKTVVDWHLNPDVQREMRRDIKRELRPTGDYIEEQLDDLANRIVELARRRSDR